MFTTRLTGAVRRITVRTRLALALVCATTLLIGLVGPPSAGAATPTISLGTAANLRCSPERRSPTPAPPRSTVTSG